MPRSPTIASPIFTSIASRSLKLIGWPVDGGYYVALVAHDQPRLQEALDAALRKIITDGRLKQLYDRWDLDGR